MGKRAQHEISAEMKAAQERFTEWRGSHAGRKAIPTALWKVASDLAAEHGIFRTAKALRLDYTKLKRLTTTAPAAKASAPLSTAFVELTGPGLAKECECVIEVQGPRGRMRIEWKGSAPPDLVSLSRMLWEPGA